MSDGMSDGRRMQQEWEEAQAREKADTRFDQEITWVFDRLRIDSTEYLRFREAFFEQDPSDAKARDRLMQAMKDKKAFMLRQLVRLEAALKSDKL